MFKRTAPPAPPAVPSPGEWLIADAIKELTRETLRQRLETAALRRVIESATGYEHPAHAHLRRLCEPWPESQMDGARRVLGEANAELKAQMEILAEIAALNVDAQAQRERAEEILRDLKAFAVKVHQDVESAMKAKR